MPYYKRRFRQPEPAQAVRKFDDGREVCLNNREGNAEYQRRKQLQWERQGGQCALETCTQRHQRMSLLEARFTSGDWDDTNQRRDDRLEDELGRSINWLVHKNCMRKWHEQQEQSGGKDEATKSEPVVLGNASAAAVRVPADFTDF